MLKTTHDRRRHSRLLLSGSLGFGMMAAAGCKTLPVHPPPTTPPSQHAVFLINTPSDARWTSTTREAASTPAHRRVLQHARAKTITGEVVDASCFLQLGKRGEAHVACGQKCVRNGQPIGIVTDRGQFYLVIAEEHHPRRDGTVNLRDRFAELMGKRVQVSGMVTEYHDLRTLFIHTLPTEQ